jgi:hypothetical protein
MPVAIASCPQCGSTDLEQGPFCPNCGTRLAQATQAAGPRADTASQVSSRTVIWWALASAAFMIIGGLGPWATAFTVSVSGTSGDGWFLIVGGLAAGAEAVRRMLAPRRLIGMIGMAVVGVVCAIVAIVDFGSFSDDLTDVVADPGWGLYLSLIASLSLCAATTVLLVQHRRASRMPAARATSAN